MVFKRWEREEGNMLEGYIGKVLRVDLTSKKIQEQELSDQVLRKYMGGVGIGAYYLYNEVPPNTYWSDPNNIIIIATGPLTGTSVGGSGGIGCIFEVKWF
jgi:aldehyde:ferredoxin oxidoreductase